MYYTLFRGFEWDINDMLRRIAVIFFILASLVLQVRSVYACELLDGLTTAKCCCSHDILHEDCSLDNRCPASHTSRQDPCCISVITLDTQFITEISGPAEYEKTWTVTAPPLTVIINSTNLELLQGSKQRLITAYGSHLIYPKLPLYQATNRLRI